MILLLKLEQLIYMQLQLNEFHPIQYIWKDHHKQSHLDRYTLLMY